MLVCTMLFSIMSEPFNFTFEDHLVFMTVPCSVFRDLDCILSSLIKNKRHTRAVILSVFDTAHRSKRSLVNSFFALSRVKFRCCGSTELRTAINLGWNLVLKRLLEVCHASLDLGTHLCPWMTRFWSTMSVLQNIFV